MKNGHALAFDRKAEAIYRKKLKTKLERKYKGRIVAIDVESGDYFLGKTVLEAIPLNNRQGLLGTQLVQGCRLTIYFGKRTVNILHERK